MPRSALHPSSSKDFLARGEFSQGSIGFADSRKENAKVSLGIDANSEIHLFAEGGQEFIVTPTKLVKKWVHIKDEFKPRSSLNFLDADGRQRSLLLKLDSAQIEDEQLVLFGPVLHDAKVEKGLGFDEIVGEDAISAAEKFIQETGDSADIRNVELNFDTLPIKEFKGGYDEHFDDSRDRLEMQIQRTSLISTNSGEDSLGSQISLPSKSLNFSKDFTFSGTTVGVTTSLSGATVFSADLQTPGFLHNILDPDAWKLSLNAGLDLNGSVALKTGIESGTGAGLKGGIPLPKVYDGSLVVSIPLLASDKLTIGPALDYGLGFNLKGVNSEYRYTADYNPRANLTLPGRGEPSLSASGKASFTPAKFDPVTGVSLNAMVQPSLSAEYSFTVQKGLFNPEITTRIKGGIYLPTTLAIGSDASASISSKSYASFSGSFLQGTQFASNFDKQITLYDYNSGNLV